MTLADRTIAALRANHDHLSGVVAGLTPEQLSAPSAASEWPIHQVLSHLGSGAEITLATLQRAVGERESVPDDFNRSVWDRWDAMGPQEHAEQFLPSNAALVEAYEALTPEQREGLRVELGFLPAPISLAGAAGLRLNEAVLHAWDVDAGLDATAGLDAEAAGLLIEQLTGELAFLVGFIGKTDRLGRAAVVAAPGLTIAIDDGVALRSSSDGVDAHFDGPQEAVVRLLTGRLGPAHTPDDVAVTGSVTLDELRAVFPGF